MTAEAEPLEVVSRFLAMWDHPGGFAEAVRAYFTETTRYENVGMSNTTGVEETLAFIDGFEAQVGEGVCIRVTTLSFAINGDTVMNERIDEVIAADGTVMTSIRLMGVFVVAGGKISEWRDYFDTAVLAQD